MSEFGTTRGFDNTCPHCGYHSDSASMAEGKHRDPHSGDFSICIDCGGLAVFNQKMKLQMPTLKETMELQTEAPEQWAMINKSQYYIRRRGRIPR